MPPSPAGRDRPLLHLPALRAPRPATLARVVTLVATIVVLGGCGRLLGTQPPATPTDFPGLTGRLKIAGIVVDDWVSGDAGCTDPNLVPASISFHARGLDQATPVKVYLYVFRDRAAWERRRDAIGPCAQAYVTDPQTYQEIQESPYVVAGQGPWATQFEAAMRSVLTGAAGTGG